MTIFGKTVSGIHLSHLGSGFDFHVAKIGGRRDGPQGSREAARDCAQCNWTPLCRFVKFEAVIEITAEREFVTWRC